jgi:hypothetical protein
VPLIALAGSLLGCIATELRADAFARRSRTKSVSAVGEVPGGV